MFKELFTEAFPEWKVIFVTPGNVRPPKTVFVRGRSEDDAKQNAWDKLVEISNNSTKVAGLYDIKSIKKNKV